MRWLGLLLLLCAGCKRAPAPAPAAPKDQPFELVFGAETTAFAVPATLVGDGAPHELGETCSPAPVRVEKRPASIAARVDTPCGKRDLPMKISVDAAGEGDKWNVRIAQLVYAINETMPLVPVYFDNRHGKAAKLEIGQLVLQLPAGQSGRRLVPFPACSEGRSVKLDGAEIGKIAGEVRAYANDWRPAACVASSGKAPLISAPGLLVSTARWPCYTLQTRHYADRSLAPVTKGSEPRVVKPRGKQLVELDQFVDYFLTPAPPTLEVSGSTADLVELAAPAKCR